MRNIPLMRQQGLLGSTSEIIEARPQMSLCWKQLVLGRCVLTATALSPLVFNPEDEIVRRLLSEELARSPGSQTQRHAGVRSFKDEHISEKREKRINERQEFSERTLQRGGGASFLLALEANASEWV